MAKIYLDLWALQNCKILQPKFLLECPYTFISKWYRDTIVMSNYGTFEIAKSKKKVRFRISGNFSFTMVKGHNWYVELGEVGNSENLQPQFIIETQVSFRIQRHMAKVLKELSAERISKSYNKSSFYNFRILLVYHGTGKQL